MAVSMNQGSPSPRQMSRGETRGAWRQGRHVGAWRRYATAWKQVQADPEGSDWGPAIGEVDVEGSGLGLGRSQGLGSGCMRSVCMYSTFRLPNTFEPTALLTAMSP